MRECQYLETFQNYEAEFHGRMDRMWLMRRRNDITQPNRN
jgi:hypothetical protein